MRNISEFGVPLGEFQQYRVGERDVLHHLGVDCASCTVTVGNLRSNLMGLCRKPCQLIRNEVSEVRSDTKDDKILHRSVGRSFIYPCLVAVSP